jgi:hypothetical protein
VDLALPLEVTMVGILGQLIGRAFPGSVIDFATAPAGHMRFKIPRAEVQEWQDREDDEG